MQNMIIVHNHTTTTGNIQSYTRTDNKALDPHLDRLPSSRIIIGLHHV